MTLLQIAGSVLTVYLLVLALLWFAQERLIFMPEPLPHAHRFDFGPDVHETWVDVPGARLNALHLKLPASDGVVFYLHGNAGNLQGWFSNTGLFRRANLDLFMLDYRGYGKSSGRIENQQQLLADVRAAWAQLAPQYAGRRRVFFGRSLGSALAATLAAEVQPELTVLVSPYESLGALAAQHYPWVPRLLLRYPLDTAAALARVKGPVLLVHGEQDEVIDAAHSERLRARSPQARLLKVAGAGHNDLQLFDAYQDGLAAALRVPR
jgi:hypothetical protein